MPISQFKDYLFPNSLGEVLSLLNSKREKAKIIGGGTTFFELAQRGLFSDVDCIIDLKNVGLDYVKEEPSEIRIGGTATMSELLKNESLRLPYLGAFLDALACVEPMQVRNVATIGGTVCASIPFFDVPIALCALQASAKIMNADTEKEIPIESIFLDNLVSNLDPSEFLVEVVVPKVNSVSCFLKHGRAGFDIGTVTCAIRLGVDRNSNITSPRVFFGNVSNTPYRATEVEPVLQGRGIEDDLGKEINDALESLEPTPTLQGSADYKKDVSKVLLRRALAICKNRARDVSL